LIDRTVLDRPPLGVLYQLTESGRAIGPGLQRLGDWAERYMTPAKPRRRRPSGAGSTKRPRKSPASAR
jgi:DNA-binding HxlR family transcriptional regulator